MNDTELEQPFDECVASSPKDDRIERWEEPES